MNASGPGAAASAPRPAQPRLAQRSPWWDQVSGPPAAMGRMPTRLGRAVMIMMRAACPALAAAAEPPANASPRVPPQAQHGPPARPGPTQSAQEAAGEILGPAGLGCSQAALPPAALLRLLGPGPAEPFKLPKPRLFTERLGT